MNTTEKISLADICCYLRVDLEVVSGFAEFGLYPTVEVDGDIRIEVQDLDILKRAISLYQTLGVNKEGIEVILKLSDKISSLQDEVDGLRHDVMRLRERLVDQDPERLRTLGLLIEIE